MNCKQYKFHRNNSSLQNFSWKVRRSNLHDGSHEVFNAGKQKGVSVTCIQSNVVQMNGSPPVLEQVGNVKPEQNKNVFFHSATSCQFFMRRNLFLLIFLHHHLVMLLANFCSAGTNIKERELSEIFRPDLLMLEANISYRVKPCMNL